MKAKYLIILLILYMNSLFGQVGYNEEVHIDDHYNSSYPITAIFNNGERIFGYLSYSEDNFEYKLYDKFLNFKSYSKVEIDGPNGLLLYPTIGNDILAIYRPGNEFFAQIFNLEGELLGNRIEVSSTKAAIDFNYLTFFDDSFIVTWIDIYGENSRDIYAQRFSSSGEKLQSNIQLTNSSVGWDHSITLLGDGSFVICWDKKNGHGIYAQLFSKDMIKISGEFQVYTDNETYLHHPKCLSINDEKFVVAYETEHDIRIQIFNNNGSKIGSQIKVNFMNPNYIELSHIIKLNKDWFMICWKGDNNIFVQVFNNNGVKIGNEYQLTSLNEEENLLNGWDFQYLKEDVWSICYKYVDFIYLENYGEYKYPLYAKYFLPEPVEHELSNFQINSPQIDETINNAKPQFKWQSSYNGHRNFPWDVTYDIYISKTEDFSDPLVYREIEDTTYQLQDTLDFGQIYYWKVQTVNWEYDSLWCSNVNGFFVSYDAEVGVDEEETLLSEFSLSQNYPNPFNPTTTIGFEIPFSTKVEIVVYSLSGKKIKTLVNFNYNSGYHNIVWDGMDNFGTKVSSGIYYYKLITDLKVISKKMILMK